MDDGNLADVFKIVLRYLKIILVSEKTVAKAQTQKNVGYNKNKILSSNCNLVLPNRPVLSKRTAIEAKAELLKILDVIDKLDAQYGFYLIKMCFDVPKLQ